MSLGTGPDRPANELIDFLATRQVLLVLDNCEHLIDACAALVDEILERCPDVTVLATSREAMRLQGEQVHPVDPLPVAGDDLSETSEAVQLFCESRRRRSPRLRDVRPARPTSPRSAGGSTASPWPSSSPPRRSHTSRRTRSSTASATAGAVQRGAPPSRRASGRSTGRSTGATRSWTDEERAVFRRLAVFPGQLHAAAPSPSCEERTRLEPLLAAAQIPDRRRGRRHGHALPDARDRAGLRRREARWRPARSASATATVRHFLAWVEAIPPELTYLDPDGAVRREQHNLRGRPHVVRRTRDGWTSSAGWPAR